MDTGWSNPSQGVFPEGVPGGKVSGQAVSSKLLFSEMSRLGLSQMWPLPIKMLLHGSVEGPTGTASATIWNSRAPQDVFSSEVLASNFPRN